MLSRVTHRPRTKSRWLYQAALAAGCLIGLAGLAWNGVVSPVTIKDWESDKVITTVESETQVLRAFEEAGVEFLNGSSPGVMRRAVVVQPNQLETKVTYRKNPRGSQAIVLSP